MMQSLWITSLYDTHDMRRLEIVGVYTSKDLANQAGEKALEMKTPNVTYHIKSVGIDVFPKSY